MCRADNGRPLRSALSRRQTFAVRLSRAERLGPRKQIVVAMDWTDFDADDQTTLALNVTAGRRR
jgi:hypothetical protein